MVQRTAVHRGYADRYLLYQPAWQRTGQPGEAHRPPCGPRPVTPSGMTGGFGMNQNKLNFMFATLVGLIVFFSCSLFLTNKKLDSILENLSDM